jgi:hypothetical protein
MIEETVEQLLAQGDKPAAVKQLYEMIIEAAGRRDFAGAEALRLKLIAIDDMALTEIIGSAEVIEAAKAAAIDPSWHEQWQDLCSRLSEEENNALYFALKEATLRPGMAFIDQGKLNNRLFFIMQGQANIVCRQQAREVLCHQLKAGDIAGEDTFFGISICTTSIICQSLVTVKYLERKSTEGWHESVPSLEEKLRVYCQGYASFGHGQVSKNLERRQNKRYPLEAVLNARLQNLKGQDVGVSFRGVLDDVSVGGVCFYIKCSQQSTARMLLGRPVCLTFSLGKVAMDLRGVIVSSKHHLRNDYTVHVKVTNTDDPLFKKLLVELQARQ